MEGIIAAAKEAEARNPTEVAESFSDGIFILSLRKKIEGLMNQQGGMLWANEALRSLARAVFEYAYWLLENADEYDSPKSNHNNLGGEEKGVIAELREAITTALKHFN